MAGTFEVQPGRVWAAAGWLFDWVVSRIAENVDDDGLKHRLELIVRSNVQDLELAEFTEAQQVAIKAVIRDRLVEDASAEWPADMPVDREGAIAHLRELSDLAGSS